MDDKKVLLQSFDFKWQADVLAGKLAEKNIVADLVFRPREYAQIVVGGSNDATEVFVLRKDYVVARRILEDYLPDESSPKIEVPAVTPSTPVLLKKIVVYSLMAVVVLPLVFNYLAFRKYQEFIKLQPGLGQHLAAVAAQLLSALGLVVMAYLFVRSELLL
jgi:hypothetical protein